MKDLYDDIDSSNQNAYFDEDLKNIAESAKNIYAVDLDSFSLEAKKKKKKHPMFEGVTRSELKRGIIFSEILGKPKAW